LNASMIITLTETGLTTRLVCKYRPPVPVVAITTWKHTVQSLSVTKGTLSMYVESLTGTDKLVEKALELGWGMGLVKPGSRVLVVSGIMEGVQGKTNSMRVLTVGETYKNIKL